MTESVRESESVRERAGMRVCKRESDRERAGVRVWESVCESVCERE